MADKPQNISLTAREFLYLGLHRTNKTAKPESLARDQWVWFMIEGIAQLKTLVLAHRFKKNSNRNLDVEEGIVAARICRDKSWIHSAERKHGLGLKFHGIPDERGQ